MFGEFIKQKRLEKDLGLREFCRQLDEDASNWSKIERGIMGPPQDEGKLKNRQFCGKSSGQDLKLISI